MSRNFRFFPVIFTATTACLFCSSPLRVSASPVLERTQAFPANSPSVMRETLLLFTDSIIDIQAHDAWESYEQTLTIQKSEQERIENQEYTETSPEPDEMNEYTYEEYEKTVLEPVPAEPVIEEVVDEVLEEIDPEPAATQPAPEEVVETPVDESESMVWDGPKLTAAMGVNQGPLGRETYYNLPMEGVVSIMRSIGFSESEYPYWVREDGCKMLGPYIMVGADFSVHPRGSVVPCSLGTALVCDTGGFVYMALDPNWLDIATTW